MPGQEMPPGIGLALLLSALLEHWMLTLSFLAACGALVFGLVKGIPLLFPKGKTAKVAPK